MAEDIRSTKEILEELFKDKTVTKGEKTYKEKSALGKYAMVRRTQYEINLWRNYRAKGYSLNEVPKAYRLYFSQKFLCGKPMNSVGDTELLNALDRLNHAVNDGCKPRCTNLAKELNRALENIGLPPIEDVEGFLNWLTFDYIVNYDYEGNPVTEQPYGFEIRIFKSDQNRKEFWFLIQKQLSNKRLIKLQETAWWVYHLQNASVAIRD